MREGAWEGAKQPEVSSKRRGIDGSRRRKFQTPAAEAPGALFGREGARRPAADLSAGPDRTGPRWAGAAANSRAVITQGPGG